MVADVLSTSRIDRITFDFSVATAIAVLARYLLYAIPAGTALGTIIIDALLAPLFGLGLTIVAGSWLLSAAARTARRGAVYAPLLSRKARIGGIAIVGLAAGATLVAEADPFLAHALAFLLPSAFVTTCGLWLCMLAFRKWHTSPRKWLRSLPDQVAIATSAAALLVAADRDLLTTQWATVLLFPVAIAGSPPAVDRDAEGQAAAHQGRGRHHAVPDARWSACPVPRGWRTSSACPEQRFP